MRASKATVPRKPTHWLIYATFITTTMPHLQRTARRADKNSRPVDVSNKCWWNISSETFPFFSSFIRIGVPSEGLFDPDGKWWAGRTGITTTIKVIKLKLKIRVANEFEKSHWVYTFSVAFSFQSFPWNWELNGRFKNKINCCSVVRENHR